MVQETIEQTHQSSRNHLLKLEHALNEQSKIIYSMRDRIMDMETNQMFTILLEYIENYIRKLVAKYYPEYIDVPNSKAFIEELSLVYLSLDWNEIELQELNRFEVEEKALAAFTEMEPMILALQEDTEWGSRLRAFMLKQIDTNWMSHLDEMNRVKEGIGLSGYGQQDPYMLFEKEALEQFEQLLVQIESGISIHFMEYVKSQRDEEEVELDEKEEEK